MKINFDQVSLQNSSMIKTSTPVENANTKAVQSISRPVDFLSGENTVIRDKKEKKTFEDISAGAKNIDVDNLSDYRTLMANTMSEEDYKKACEDGFDLGNLDHKKSVTILDRIKAEVAKSGKDVPGFTDDLDEETVAEALGSDTLARSITSALGSENVPVTKENLSGIKLAVSMAKSIDMLTDTAVGAMVSKGELPTIENIYFAVNSTSEKAGANAPSFMIQGVSGYMTRLENTKDAPLTEGEIRDVLEQSGLEKTEENIELAGMALKNNIEVSDENLDKIKTFKSVDFPLSVDKLSKSIAAALAEGKPAVKADLTKEKSIYKKAAELFEYINSPEAEKVDAGVNAKSVPGSESLSRTRVLTEIRLKMTAEVNLKLIASGVAIDTKDLDGLLENLKAAEKNVAEEYFADAPDAVEKYEEWTALDKAIANIRTFPAETAGINEGHPQDISLNEFYDKGVLIKADFEKAGRAYESLLSAPRADLGDRITKAFANVDDILSDLSMDLNEENRKAVRILGYNSMEITSENINTIKQAVDTVKGVVDRLTPATTLSMIRDNVNPMEKSFAELKEYLDSRDEPFETKAVSYSRFLYSLERDKNITPEERDGFIGIYRLLNQIEKNDSSVIGAVVNAGAELNFENMLAASRSRKVKNMDFTIDDSFGEAVEVIKSEKSITDQITAAFSAGARNITEGISGDEALEEAYGKEYEEFRMTAKDFEPEIKQALTKSDIPVTPENLSSATAVLDESNFIYEKIKAKEEKLKGKSDINLSKIKADLPEDKDAFTESYRDFLSDVMDSLEELGEAEADSYIDVREIMLFHKQLSVASGLADADRYAFPMEVNGKIFNVHLSFEKGNAPGTVQMTVERNGEVEEVYLEIRNNRIYGYLTGNSDEAINELASAVDIFNKQIKEDATNNLEVEAINVIRKSQKDPDYTRPGWNREVPSDLNTVEKHDNSTLYRIAKMMLTSIKK
ncbi:MAG: DUF6240 domain-containing protein [Acetatifactor sp.]|nr:DUF6240 domain-containing protein [Acetatifactor sp.]